MNRDFDKLPIGGHVADNLTPEEKKALYQAARENQEVFDRLADDEDLRELLASPQARRELLEAIEDAEQTIWVRLVSWLQRPSGLALAGGLAAVAFFVGLFSDRIFVNKGSIEVPPVLTERIEGASQISTEMTVRLFDIAVSAATKELGAPDLELESSYRVGNTFRIRFTAPSNSIAYVLERRPDGSFVQHFPSPPLAEPRVGETGTVVIPAPDKGDVMVSSQVGKHRVRLVVFPPGVDLSKEFEAAARKATVIEKEYVVEP